ncbi:unnamed protein product [Polarella glacialis]|uniref:J domain-containing protein n=1 Tax=Polarella glacialis TaxID=89957 RepID=A0A813GEX1_POLGL|nr:unnamed protein product [Polarella glacialis]
MYGSYGAYPRGGPKGGGKGSARGGGRPPAVHTSRMAIPEGAIGLVLGSKGTNIKAMQASPGVTFVSLAGTCLDIGGSKEAVQDVEMNVRAILNKFHTSSARTNCKQLHFDVSSCDQFTLRFTPASAGKLIADFSACATGRQYFVLTAAPYADDVVRRLGGLAISARAQGPEGGQLQVRVPMDVKAMCSLFANFLEGLADVHSNHEKVVVEVRFGVTAFHALSVAALQDSALEQFKALAPHVDYKLQFANQLRLSTAELQEKLSREGFEVMDRECCTVVHLVNTSKGEAYAVVFVEPEAGEEGDPRLSDTKHRELARIANCRTSAEVLELSSPAGASTVAAAVKKAYLKKSLMVHPDKNAFPGATEAMKVLGTARDALLGGSRADRLSPPLFVVGASAAQQLPQIAHFHQAKAYMQADVVKTDGHLGFRVAVSSKAETDHQEAREFLEKAWRQGTIVAGGLLEANDKYSIDSVRFKEKMLLSNGGLSVSLETVRQKSLESAGHFQTFPEVTFTCPALTEAIQDLHVLQSVNGKARAMELFGMLIQSANDLAPKMAKLS